MGFALKGFVTGAAVAVGAKMDADETAAKETAKTNVLSLQRTSLENKAKRETLAEEYSKTIDALAAHGGFTQQQLYAIALNKPVAEQTVAALKEGNFDRSKLNPEMFAKVAGTVATDFDAKKEIRTQLDKINAAPPIPVPEGLGYFASRQEAIQRNEMARQAKAMGMTYEQLVGAAQPVKPIESPETKYDMSMIAKTKSVEQQKALILSDITAAKNSNDPEALSKATTAAGEFAASERLMSANLDAKQALIDKVMAEPANAKLSNEQQLRKRQQLETKPGEGLDRLSASDVARAARGAYNEILAVTLGKGKFSSVTNPTTGETSTVPTDLVKPEELDAAKKASRQGVINMYTDPRTGLPKSAFYKNALIEIGAGFDESGRVVSAPPKAVAQPSVDQSQTAQPVTIESSLKAQNLAYEPDKFDYRLDSDGSVASRPKAAPVVTEKPTAQPLLPWQERQIQETRDRAAKQKAQADADKKVKLDKEEAVRKRNEELDIKTKAALKAGLPTQSSKG